MKRVQLPCCFLITISFIALSKDLFSQSVGIGTSTPHVSSRVDITSTNKGLLLPRMNSASISSIINPAKGLMVYDSVKNQLMVNMGSNVTPNWQTIVFKSGWSLTGNNGLNPSVDFIGTTDLSPLRFRVNNNPAGTIDEALQNVFLGPGSGELTIGTQNAGFGFNAFNKNTIGAFNTAIGSWALESNTSGVSNVAVGFESMRLNTTGGGNTAVGIVSLHNNINGVENTATGLQALYENISGSYNTANGDYSMSGNHNGSYNTAMGYNALGENLNSYNTAIGAWALYHTTTSQYNVAVGFGAGFSYDHGYNNVFVGANTGVNGEGYYNVICVGQGTIAGSPSHARFGNPATIHYGGWANWSNLSDGRFKKNVKENVPGIEFINKLRPVTYNLEATAVDAFWHKNSKDEMSPGARAVHQKALKEKEAICYTGFIAQEVETAAKQLGFNFSGVEAPKNENDTYSLRYAEFVVPLVKAVQDQHVQIEELKKEFYLLKEQNKLLMQLLIKK